MTNPEPIVSLHRAVLVWVGSVLLEYGHVVQVPPGDHELVVHKKKPRKIRVELREQIDLSKPRVPVACIADLDTQIPDVVILVPNGCFEQPHLHVIPVERTRNSWITEGRHYAVPTEHLVPFLALDAWLKKLP